MADKTTVTLGEAKLITGESDSTVLREKLAGKGIDVPLRGRGTAIPVSVLEELGYKVDMEKLTATPAAAAVNDKALQDLDSKIEKAKAKIESLKAEVAELTAERKARYKELTSVKAKAEQKAARLRERAERLLAEAASLSKAE
jgi:peptidoglycan hydrolase CwlO-like protein